MLLEYNARSHPLYSTHTRVEQDKLLFEFGDGHVTDHSLGPSRGNNKSGNRRQTNRKSEFSPCTSRADEDENSKSAMEDEDAARRQVRPIRRKYNIFRQTRPRGSNPERAIALVCHFGR